MRTAGHALDKNPDGVALAGELCHETLSRFAQNPVEISGASLRARRSMEDRRLPPVRRS